jgi:type I restriction enzyme S subunit
MEVKQGYKQTEVGLIPVDWGISSMGEICLKIQDGTHFSPRSGGRDYLYITSKNIRFGYLDISSASLIDREQHQSIYRRCDVKKGDLLLTKDGANTGNVALNTLDEEFSLLSSVAFLRFHESKHITGYYLQQFLAPAGQRRMQDAMAGNAITRLTLDKINKLKFPVPPTKAEQEAIAEALSDADALIESLEQLIQKKRLIKQSAMQELLRPKDGWVTMKLGSLGSFLKGSGVRREDAISGDIPCVRYGEIYTRHNDFIKVFDSWISPEVALTAKPMKTGDMLFAGSGETKEDIGKCVAFLDDFEAYAGGDIIILRPENVNSRFLGYYLNSESINRQKASKGQGDAVVHITANALADVDLMMPSVDEQFAIASVLSDMDAELSSLEEKLMKVRHLKQGMMHNLLTGKIRLI